MGETSQSLDIQKKKKIDSTEEHGNLPYHAGEKKSPYHDAGEKDIFKKSATGCEGNRRNILVIKDIKKKKHTTSSCGGMQRVGGWMKQLV